MYTHCQIKLNILQVYIDAIIEILKSKNQL
jgi:hypothetical protein